MRRLWLAMIGVGLAIAGGGCGTSALPRPVARAQSAMTSPAPAIAVRYLQNFQDGGDITLRRAGDALDIDIISPHGIGSARLDLMSGSWPAHVTVHLRYAPGVNYSHIEGCIAALEETGRATTEPRRSLDVHLLGMRGFTFYIPPTTMRVLYINWVDAYRE